MKSVFLQWLFSLQVDSPYKLRNQNKLMFYAFDFPPFSQSDGWQLKLIMRKRIYVVVIIVCRKWEKKTLPLSSLAAKENPTQIIYAFHRTCVKWLFLFSLFCFSSLMSLLVVFFSLGTLILSLARVKPIVMWSFLLDYNYVDPWFPLDCKV